MKTKFYIEKYSGSKNYISFKNNYIWIGNKNECFGWLTKEETLHFAKMLLKKLEE